jgi:hypothetical protein
MPTIRGDKIHIHQKKCLGEEQNCCVPSAWCFIMSWRCGDKALHRHAGKDSYRRFLSSFQRLKEV